MMQLIAIAVLTLSVILLSTGIRRNEKSKGRRFRLTSGGRNIVAARLLAAASLAMLIIDLLISDHVLL